MRVQYLSTRESSPRVGFAEALRAGLAPDGGLYVPDRIPPLPEGWRDAPTFSALGERVLSNWLEGEFEAGALSRAVTDALNFPVELRSLQGGEWDQVYVVELFHGPTLSFKDFGARTMARLMPMAAGEDVTILVATSGDTGSAVADGFSGVEGVRVVLLYPEGQVSPTQERQLIVRRPGVTTLAVQGTFDDCQRLVKGAFADPALEEVTLSSANSINIGRLLPQSVYYLWAGREIGEPLDVCVPSGNLGNLTGAMLARKGGLGVGAFIAAHNANSAFPRYLAGSAASFGASVRTLSNAMDVGAPSNFERLAFMLGDAGLRSSVWGTSVDDDTTMATMRRVLDETGYLCDPHTAVGLEAVRRYRAQGGPVRPVAVMSTAHPAKFPEVVERAVGQTAPVPARLQALWTQPTQVRRIDADAAALREVIRA